MKRIAVSILTVALALPLAAQPPSTDSTLDKTKKLAEVAAQKTESDVRATLREVIPLEKTDRPQTIQKLKDSVAALESDTSLSPSQKSTLLRVVRDRLRIVELGPDSAEVITKQNQAEEAKQTAEKAEAVRAADEKKKAKEGLDAIAKLRKDGKNAEANKLVNELVGKYPNSLALQLLAGQTGLEKAIKAADKDRKDADPKVLAALRDVDHSATPIDGNMAFPSDFKDKTKNRRDDSGPTTEERAMIKSLESVIDARYKNSRFQDVIDHISTAINRTIIADAGALTEAGITYDSPVNFVAREPIATRTALRSVLGSLNLTYVVRDNIIYVTTPLKARELMTTKVYYIGDLIVGAGPYGGTPTLGMANDQIQTVNNITALVDMITGAIDPQSWEKRGGQGHLGVNLPTLTLTVRQSQEVHAMLRSTLYGTKK
jgi:hypothetical protein